MDGGGGDTAAVKSWGTAACSTCGPGIQEITETIERMGKHWANFGYPVDLNSVISTEEIQVPVKKIKLEPSSPSMSSVISMSTCCKGNPVLEILTKRIEILEKQWETYFGDVDQQSSESTTNQTSNNIKKEDEAISTNEDTGHDEEDEYQESYANEEERPNPSERSDNFRYRCPLCSTHIDSLDEAKSHLEGVHSDFSKLLPCPHPTCDRLFVSGKERRKHKRVDHHIKPDCLLCNRNLLSARWLEDHLFRVHNLYQINTCPKCGKYFDHHWSYLQHIAEHEQSTGQRILWSCSHCVKPRYFSTETEQLDHETLIHNHQCSICWQNFPTVMLYNFHLRMQHDINV